MRARSTCALSLVVLIAWAPAALAQQGTAASRNRPGARAPRAYQVVQQQSRTSQRRSRTDVASRSRRPTGGEVVKEEVVSTIFSQVIAGGLTNPCGIAVQPYTDQVFIADSGAGRIVRLNDVAGAYSFEAVITGFPTAAGGKNPAFESGPLGMAFVDKYTLVVAGGGQPGESTALRAYRPPHNGRIDAGRILYQLGPLGDGKESSSRGGFFGVVATEQTIYATCPGAGSDGCIARSQIGDGQAEAPTAFVDGSKQLGLVRPSGVAIGRKGQLIAAHMGSTDVPHDSRLAIYDPADGQRLLDVGTNLHDIVAIAVSPKSGRIYAADFAWIAPEEGGLYRLDVTRDGPDWICRAVQLMPLDRPSGLAFSGDNTLFITTFGSHNAEHRGGLLVRVYNDSNL